MNQVSFRARTPTAGTGMGAYRTWTPRGVVVRLPPGIDVEIGAVLGLAQTGGGIRAASPPDKTAGGVHAAMMDSAAYRPSAPPATSPRAGHPRGLLVLAFPEG